MRKNEQRSKVAFEQWSDNDSSFINANDRHIFTNPNSGLICITMTDGQLKLMNQKYSVNWVDGRKQENRIYFF